MKKLLLLVIVLLLRFPLADWNALTDEQRQLGVVSLLEQFCEKESCQKVKAQVGNDEEYIYFRFECLEKKL